MEGLSLKFKKELYEEVKVDLLVEILATQISTARTLITLVSSSDEVVGRNIEVWRKEVEVEKKDIIDSLYAKYGNVDFKDLLK